jgi:bifunctional DNA primase/polymerase-like protein/DnaB helicase-like protein
MINQLLLNWARKYLELGWSIIPIEPKGKRPLIKWEEFQSRRASEAEVLEWLEQWPEMNVGLVTGQLSGVAVVDLDGPEGIKHGHSQSLTSGITAKSPNGRHFYYKWQNGIQNSASKIAPNVDIRGEGGYVVVSPSIHPSGRMYRWERFVPALIPDFPIHLLAATSTEESTKNAEANVEGWLAEALEEMKNGHVHNTLVSVLGKFRHHNFSVDDTVRLLAPHCPEGFTGLEEKVREIWGRYQPSGDMRQTVSTSAYSLYNSPTASLSIKSPTNDNDFEHFQLHSQGNTISGLRLNTGFPNLDRFLEGGLKSERLFTVAARTGTGKTNFAIALARNLCEQGKKVLFFSTEFQYSKIWARYIATLHSAGEFRGHAFHVCDSFSPNISQVEEALKKVMPDVFIFDHINHIGDERESLGAFMQGSNFLQRKYNAQGCMVAQLNRQADWVEQGKRVEPRMSMIKGSGTIEQASSRVLLLSETRVTPEFNEILGVLDKNDSGDRGIIQFGLYKNPYVFKELI